MSTSPPPPWSTRLANAARFARGLSVGLARGHFFPAAGRRPVRSAPEGSARAPWKLGPNEAKSFKEATHRFALPGLPAALDVLQLTDIHVRGEGPWLDALLQFLASLRPADLVVYTGDLVTLGWTEPAIRRALRAAPRGRLGTFAVRGNWERWSGAEGPAWEAILRDAGIEPLLNQTRTVGGLTLIGLDDALSGRPDLSLLDAFSPSATSLTPGLVLTHSPSLFPELARLGAPLVLCGHSHAGQVRLPLLGAAWVPRGTGEGVAGWYFQGSSAMHVSSGLGWSIAPLRLACPPEVDRLTLVPPTSA
jgi:predicted MPP superfamily phosphohydrolase